MTTILEGKQLTKREQSLKRLIRQARQAAEHLRIAIAQVPEALNPPISFKFFWAEIVPHGGKQIFAEAVGVEAGTMSTYASGVRNPSPEVKAKIVAEALAQYGKHVKFDM